MFALTLFFMILFSFVVSCYVLSLLMKERSTFKGIFKKKVVPSDLPTKPFEKFEKKVTSSLDE